MTVTKEQFFKPGRMTGQDKEAAIDSAAKQIIVKETADREIKTERLRKLRLAHQAEAASSEPKRKQSRAA